MCTCNKSVYSVLHNYEGSHRYEKRFLSQHTQILNDMDHCRYRTFVLERIYYIQQSWLKTWTDGWLEIVLESNIRS